MTVSKLREFEALQTEKHREHESKLRELEGEIGKANKPKGESARLWTFFFLVGGIAVVAPRLIAIVHEHTALAGLAVKAEVAKANELL